ncbi:MAG TPA: MFS transporter [Arenimonas sp.]|nr:MFS transporter [Arenimonas sp.]
MNAVLAQDLQDSTVGSARRRMSIAILALTSMLAFESIGVTTAMPAVAAALGGISLYALAFAATLATSVVGMVAADMWCDRHGSRVCLQAGMLLFGGGLLAAGLADSMGWLVGGRALQGLGSGMLSVAIYVAIGRLYPAASRPRMFALLAAAWVLPAIVGPSLAGVLVDAFSWRSIFLSALLLLLPTALLLRSALQQLQPPGSSASAVRGSRSRLWLALAAAAAALLVNLASAPSGIGRAWLLLAIPALALATRGLLPAGALRAARGIPSVVALRGLLASSFLAAEVFMPLWLTERHGWSLSAAGLALSAGALLWSAGSWMQSRITAPERRLHVLRTGFVVVAVGIGMVAATAWLEPLPPLPALLGWSLAGLGIGMAFPGLSVLLLALSPIDRQGSHASSLQLSDALCSTSLLALCGIGFATLHATAPAAAFVAVFALAAGLAALGGAISGRTVP